MKQAAFRKIVVYPILKYFAVSRNPDLRHPLVEAAGHSLESGGVVRLSKSLRLAQERVFH